MSRQKQLITVFDVANAKKQGIIGAMLDLASSMTMFQALEPEKPAASWRVYAPCPFKTKSRPFGLLFLLERIMSLVKKTLAKRF